MSARVFQYHAHGFALGGSIFQPFKAELDSHAATTLPVVGGYASANAENYRFKDLVSFKSAHTYISGIRNEDGAHSTVVNTVVEELDILGIITADAIIGRLSSKHKDDDSEPEIIPLGSSFENLRIAGQPVQVDLSNELFLNHPTYSALTMHLTSQEPRGADAAANVRYVWERAGDELPPQLEKGMLVPPQVGFAHSKGVLHNSVVKQVRLSNSDSSVHEVPYGYAIRIPQVGCIYLGEIFTSGTMKRLTMLRAELGSPVVGTIAAAGPVTNGNWYP